MIDPPARDDEEAVVEGDARVGEESGQEKPDSAGNRVDPAQSVQPIVQLDGREEIGHVIDANPDLELGEQVGHDGREEANGDGERRRDEASSGRDGDETGNGAGAEADDAPLAGDAVVHQHPGDAGDGASQVGVNDREGGLEVGRKGRTAVAARVSPLWVPTTHKPSQPTQSSAVPRMTCETEWGAYARRSVP